MSRKNLKQRYEAEKLYWRWVLSLAFVVFFIEVLYQVVTG
jgi:hypothetical protein